MKLKFLFLFSATVFLFSESYSQGFDLNKGEIHGNIQVDAQYYNEDSVIGAQKVNEKMRFQSFGNLIYTNGKFSAGIRYESYEKALLGFDPEYSMGDGKSGIPFRYATYNDGEGLEITLGNFYEQFGSGMVLRTFEDRNIGYDNAFDGIKIKAAPVKGIHLTGVFGKQRVFWDVGPGIVRGIDAEAILNDLLPEMSGTEHRIIVGGSFVSRYQADRDPLIVLPENVGAAAGRLSYMFRNFSLMTEYAYKINDPSLQNGYVYNNGQTFLGQISYFVHGFSLLGGIRWTDNFSFRSDRGTDRPNTLFINYMPALTKQHTYNLPASIYPYATLPNGESGLQFEAGYQFKRGSVMGGKYGMDIAINYSQVNPIWKAPRDTTGTGDGQPYTSGIFAFDGSRTIFKDFNIEVRKKFSKSLKMNAMYMYTENDINLTLGSDLSGLLYAHIGVLDFTFRLNETNSLRTEFQTLQTRQDQGSWALALIEYTISPKWFFVVMDQYNYENPVKAQRVHYLLGSVGFIKGATRFQISYGRQRAGVLCVGGVCRVVPATNGMSVQLTTSF